LSQVGLLFLALAQERFDNLPAARRESEAGSVAAASWGTCHQAEKYESCGKIE